jgi:hypothetical protein
VTKVPFVLVLLALTTTRAAAETKGYVQAGVLATAQPAGTPNHRISPALSGTTVGATATAGFFLTPTVAIEGEIVAGRAISTQQGFFYDWSVDFTGQSRDVFLGANVRWRPAAARYLELVGGGGLAFSTVAERSVVRTERFPFPPTVRTSPQPDQVETFRQLALNGGIAVPLPVSRRIDVVPTFSIRWVDRSEAGLGDYLGVASYAYQFGAAVRFSFD